ncbi:MAG: SDR family oxidoreductase [Thiobacillaceae bacterium]|nr:SDR family oxidoreductase [Thiobacillaceae bacterium]MDW8324831.1 SDR family oxidoreductase [Burkholderiales bacterium]
MSTPYSVLVTGANRGLGLEWCRQYAAAGWRVYATCRHPEAATELQALSQRHPQVSLHRLDVTSSQDLAALRAELGEAPIDLLVNNAGVYLEKYAPDAALHYDDWLTTLAVNTLGPVRVTEALAHNLARSRRRLVVAVSSHMGSIADISAPGSYYYRSSKAALNAAMKGLSLAYRPLGIGVLILHPGWVKTRMGGYAEAPLTPEQSVAGMRRLVEGYTAAMNGRFFRYDGSELPW